MSQKQNDEPLDAPTPPGGPQRTDAPAGSQTPGRPGVPGSEAADDPGQPVGQPVDQPDDTHDDTQEDR
jgi:hypothetical protein